MNNYTFIDAVNCTNRNFFLNPDLDYNKAMNEFKQNKSKYHSKVFDSWDGYSILCPNMDVEMKLEGFEDSM